MFVVIDGYEIKDNLKNNGYHFVESQNPVEQPYPYDYTMGTVKGGWVKRMNGENWVAETKNEITSLTGHGVNVQKGMPY
jgi:hypothetical protein